ncbi:hypothetical protein APR08_004371 [Nocardia amikacinitolerans]|nr:hypothetical protein [Nocardia amikacinitolerans]
MQGGIRAQARLVVTVAAALAAILTSAAAASEAGAQPAGEYHYHPNDTRYRYDDSTGASPAT